VCAANLLARRYGILPRNSRRSVGPSAPVSCRIGSPLLVPRSPRSTRRRAGVYTADHLPRFRRVYPTPASRPQNFPPSRLDLHRPARTHRIPHNPGRCSPSLMPVASLRRLAGREDNKYLSKATIRSSASTSIAFVARFWTYKE
jgi:hypothetical protein